MSPFERHRVTLRKTAATIAGLTLYCVSLWIAVWVALHYFPVIR